MCATWRPIPKRERRRWLCALDGSGAGLLYTGTLMAAAVGVGIVAHYEIWALIALVAIPLAVAPVRLALSDKRGRELLPMLGDTARLQIVGGLLLALGVLL